MYVKSIPSLDAAFIEALSRKKNEPAWMLELRLQGLKHFTQLPLPSWGPDLQKFPYDSLAWYVEPPIQHRTSWHDVPNSIKETFERLGVPQAERALLAGVGAQFESELVYKKLKQEWVDQGVIFTDISEALQSSYHDIVRQYFSTVVPVTDNSFAALNTAVWSGGSFVFVPEGVHIHLPLQAYFRIDQESMGQFERTLIIAQPGSFVHYVEGCSAPVYRSGSLHSAVVEVIALPGAHVRYTTIQNWSTNVYNLVTKRAVAHRDAYVEWVDGNFGSAVTMKYPSIILKEPHARASVISVAFAGDKQEQDTGAKMIHLAPHTTSSVVAKSIVKKGGKATYRGLVKIVRGAHSTRSRVSCESLLLDASAQTHTYPTIKVDEPRICIEHEASVSNLTDEHIFYLMMRGLPQDHASTLMVNGFIGAFVDTLPMEYALELNRLIAHEMEGSVG